MNEKVGIAVPERGRVKCGVFSEDPAVLTSIITTSCNSQVLACLDMAMDCFL